jgi:hypothetical protein
MSGKGEIRWITAITREQAYLSQFEQMEHAVAADMAQGRTAPPKAKPVRSYER